MNFDLTPEQIQFREAVVEFATRELNAEVDARDQAAAFSRAAWEKCAEFGLQGLPVPTQYGGAGADVTTIVAAMEALGYASIDNGLIFSLNAQMWSCELPIVTFGSDDQKQRYLPALCDGSLIAAHCMTEPDSGSDAFALATTARPDEDGYVLEGSKTFVSNAAEAGLFVVFATADRSKGLGGICVFLVERDTSGVSVGKPLSKMGLRTSPMNEVFFDGCRVGPEQVLAEPGSGMAVFNSSMRWERGLILAASVGTMQRQIDRCITYARDRQQFGKPIADFQSVSNKIVDMKLRLETARLLVYRLAWLMDKGQNAALESGLAKLHVSESLVASSLDALQIHGGYGYMTEYGLERDVRDAIGSRIYSGTSEIQRNLVARHLGL
jgi:alkylation response protein AidB-like acyl-CoA dehydrogenase